MTTTYFLWRIENEQSKLEFGGQNGKEKDYLHSIRWKRV